VFDVDWHEDTVVLEKSAYERALVNESNDRFTFRAADVPETLRDISQDAHLVLSGRGLYKIMRVTKRPSELVLTVEPGSIKNASYRGKIAWNYRFGADDGALTPSVRSQRTARIADAPQSDAAVNLIATGTRNQARTASELNFEGSVNQYDVDLAIEGGNNQYDFSFTGAGQLGANVTVSGYVRGFRARGLYVYEEGELKEFIYDLADIEAQLDVRFSIMGKTDASLEVPAVLKFPFLVGPIPAFIGIGGGISLESTVDGQGTVTATFKYDQGAIKLDLREDKAEGGVDSGVVQGTTELRTTLSSGLGVIADFPRIELGIGTSYVPAEAALVTRMRHQAFANIHIERRGGSSAQCLANGSAVGADVGGELRFFNLAFNQNKLIFRNSGESSLSGNLCGACKGNNPPFWCAGIQGK